MSVRLPTHAKPPRQAATFASGGPPRWDERRPLRSPLGCRHGMGLARRHRAGMAAGIAMVLALALLAAPVAQAARSEFYGITQPRMLSVPDLYGIAGAKVHTDRFPLQWSH